MKKLAVLIMAIISFSGLFAQRKSVEITNLKVGPILGNYSKGINIERGDTTYYVYFGFQNAKYKATTDIRSIFFHTQEQLDSFISDLKSAVIEIDNKTTISWDRKDYTIYIFDSFKNIYIGESPSKGKGYTILTKKLAEELLAKLENIKIGTE